MTGVGRAPGARSVTEQLATFVADIAASDVPVSMIDHARWLLIDSVACALAATTIMPETAPLLNTADSLGAESSSTMLGLDRTSSPAAAALVNGALVHGLNYDALGPSYAHVAAGTIPATLAVAEATGSTGQTLLVATALAAEVSCRLSVAAADPLSNSGWLMGQLLAHFSSAAGAARALGLDAAATASAFGLALMQAGGTTQVMADGGAPAKAVYASFPSLSGVLAATAAGFGLDGTMDAIGGPAGLFGRFLTTGDPAIAVEGLGTTWLAERLRFKRWPNTAVAHPFLEALRGAPLAARRAVSVTFRVTEDRAAFFDPARTAWRPESVSSAGNSVPYAVACHLVAGSFDLDSLTAAAFRSPPVMALLDRTVVEWRDGGEDALEVGFDDESAVEIPVRADDDGAPAEGQDLIDKLGHCARHARHPFDDQVPLLLAAVAGLDQAPDLNALQRALRSTG